MRILGLPEGVGMRGYVIAGVFSGPVSMDGALSAWRASAYPCPESPSALTTDSPTISFLDNIRKVRVVNVEK